VKPAYLDYCWGTKFKNMEHKESDGNVALYADGGKKGNGKKQNW